MNTVICSKCKASRPSELAQGGARSPCPECGETSLIIGVSLAESISAADYLQSALIPGNQVRDWKQRWKFVQDELRDILRPHTETRSAESIHSAVQRLFSFYVLTYHLKDALKDAASELRLIRSDIESAITEDTRLALVADLANQDKHSKLARSPRSGIVPFISQIAGVDGLVHGWQLSVQIKHGDAMLDGLSVAKNAVEAWREKLSAWQLV